MSPRHDSHSRLRAILGRQFRVVLLFMVLLVTVLSGLYLVDRQREWQLRTEQAKHRLELASEWIERDLARVCSDVLFIENEASARMLPAKIDDATKAALTRNFENFLEHNPNYQQLRVIARNGSEVIRVESSNDQIVVVTEKDLQDKSGRYYVEEGLKLAVGELFVSGFDLNQEHGVIEQPINPVVRFVTPIQGHQESEYLLVANYGGATLLKELSRIALPGHTYLVREDGEYLLGQNPKDAWGWLLGHSRTMANQYPYAWSAKTAEIRLIRSPKGAFGFLPIQPSQFGRPSQPPGRFGRLWIVSHFKPESIFETSDKLLNRLLILTLVVFPPLLAITWFWSVSTHRRKEQRQQIEDSERKLRELSMRLVQTQEEERKAISREIHDQLGQQATAISLDLKLANQLVESEEAKRQLKRAINENEELLSTLHEFATRVRPAELDDLGLCDAIKSLIDNFATRTNLNIQFQWDVAGEQLSTRETQHIYRLVQESLNNVLKHAHARNCQVLVKDFVVEDRQWLKGVVTDDGIGIEEPEPSANLNATHSRNGRLGILGMRERIELLGGSFKISSGQGNGTTVEFQFPTTSNQPTA